MPRDHFQVPELFPDFCKAHKIVMAHVARGWGLNEGAVSQWSVTTTNNRGIIGTPLTVMLAAYEQFVPDELPAYVAGLQGRLRRRNRSTGVSEATLRLARHAASRLGGIKIRCEDGTTLELPAPSDIAPTVRTAASAPAAVPEPGRPEGRSWKPEFNYILSAPFDLRAFFKRHSASYREAMLAMGLGGGQRLRYERTGRYPLALLKACMQKVAPDEAEAFERAIDGRLEWGFRAALSGSAHVRNLAEKYDRARPGVALRTVAGEQLTTPGGAVRAAAIELDTQTPLSVPETTGTDSSSSAPLAELALEPAAITAAPAGVMAHPLLLALAQYLTPATVAPLTPGERELYTNLAIRLNFELNQARAENGTLRAQLRGAEGRVHHQQARMQELVKERDSYVALLERETATPAASIAKLTASPSATPADVAAVQQSFAGTPTLAKLVEELGATFQVGQSLASRSLQ